MNLAPDDYLVLKLKFMFFVQCVLPIVFFVLNVSVLLLVVCSFFVVFCLVKNACIF